MPPTCHDSYLLRTDFVLPFNLFMHFHRYVFRVFPSCVHRARVSMVKWQSTNGIVSFCLLLSCCCCCWFFLLSCLAPHYTRLSHTPIIVCPAQSASAPLPISKSQSLHMFDVCDCVSILIFFTLFASLFSLNFFLDQHLRSLIHSILLFCTGDRCAGFRRADCC